MRTASGTDTLSAALALASDGNKVFPLDGKIPFKGTRGLKDASMTQQGVRELWARHPGANIGLVTDGLLVLDFDAGHGGLNSKRITANDSSVP